MPLLPRQDLFERIGRCTTCLDCYRGLLDFSLSHFFPPAQDDQPHGNEAVERSHGSCLIVSHEILMKSHLRTTGGKRRRRENCPCWGCFLLLRRVRICRRGGFSNSFQQKLHPRTTGGKWRWREDCSCRGCFLWLRRVRIRWCVGFSNSFGNAWMQLHLA